jgi:Derlin-2/3
MPMLDELLGNMPPVSRLMIAISAIMALLATLDIVSPLSLYLNWDLVFKERQWWRPITCFFFFGEFSVHFCWHIYVYLQYCSSLEQVGFRGRSADFVWMLISSGSLLLVLTAVLKLNSSFLSSALMDVMIYLWSKKNANMLVQVIVVTVHAAYLPWTLTALSLLLGGNIQDHLLGIAVGHVYYFFSEIYPLMPTSRGVRVFGTPRVLKLLLRQNQGAEN